MHQHKEFYGKKNTNSIKDYDTFDYSPNSVK